jgi:hypothetical protein
MQPRNFFLDIQSRSFVTGPTVAAPVAAPLFFGEDIEEIALYFMEPTPDGSAAYRFINYSANTVKLAVGLTAPAALQTSWTAASTAITASITTLTTGGSGSNEVQRLSFSGDTPAEGSISLTIPSRGVTVSSVAAGLFTAADHGLLNNQSVTLSAFTISGSSFANSTYFVVARTKDTFRISNTADGEGINAQVTSGGGTATLPAITTPVVSNVTAATLQQAFVDAGIAVNSQPQIVVTGSYAQGFNFTFANSQANINIGALTASSTLAAAPGLKANVSFNTNEIAALIAAGTTSNLRLEVEVSDGTKRQTYAAACNIGDDIITTSSPAPLPPGGAPYTTLTLTDGAGGNWALSIDASGVVTTTKL